MTEKQPTRVLIVDDHEVVRRGVRSLLQSTYDICGEAVDGQDALEKARELKPNVVVMDISMPKLNGLEATPLILNILPDCEILILSQHDSAQLVQQAFKAGARGYVVKSSIGKDLLTALEKVSRHESFFDPSIQGSGEAPERIDAQEVLKRSLALERALRENEELYRTTFELAGVGVAHVSPDGRWMRVNQKLCDILGYSESELLKLGFQEITHPEDLRADLAAVKELATGEGDKYSIEKRYIRKDKSIFWANLTVSAVRDGSGKLKHFISVVEDIHERRIAEVAQARLAAIVQSSDDAVVSKDLNGVITSWNAGAERIFEYTSDEAVGRSITMIIPPELQHEEKLILKRLRNGERIEHFDTTRVTKSGKRIDVSLTISPIRDSKSRIIGASKIARDISERRQVEQALQKSESRLRAAFGQAYSFLVLLEPDGTIVEVNRAALEAAGSTRDQVVGRKFWEPWWSPLPEEVEALKEAIKNAAEGQSVRSECCYCLADGSRRFIDRTLNPVAEENGQVRMIVATGLDITEQKKLRDELESRVLERTRELEEKNKALLDQAHVIREISGRLLHSQEEERRRIARELHDSSGQIVAALQMTLVPLEAEIRKKQPELSAPVKESLNLVDQLSKELRTVSYLLHPPLLDEAGLPSAIRWYVEGFSERSKIPVDLEITPDFGRLSHELEMTVFRIIQECLTNIHRHANGQAAMVRILRSGDEILVEVQDNGKGFGGRSEGQDSSKTVREGVGIRGMRERVKQMGGTFEIRSSDSGTFVSAYFPIQRLEENDPASVHDATKVILSERSNLPGSGTFADKPAVS
jgi:PAS domain S-box-containing protein